VTPLPKLIIITDWMLGADVLLSRLEAALEDERASEIERHGLELRFRASIVRFVSSWNLLGAVDRGSFVVSEIPGGLRVSYELSYRRMFAVVTCGFIYLCMVRLGNGTPKQRWSDVLPELLFVWAVVFGANYLISVARFPQFIRRALAGEY